MCNDVLLRFPGEPAARHRGAASPLLATRYRIAFVPGLFADCVEKWLQPFSDAILDLHRTGFDTAVLRIAGRAGAEQNAGWLAREVKALPQDGKRLIIFAYSKGLPDVMDMLVRDPETGRRIAAVVSYAGAFNGSPLAEEWRGVYDQFLTRFPLDNCAAGTGAELEALRPSVREAWWRAHQAELRDTRVPFFSLVGAPLPDHVSPLLRLTHASLATRDPHNDGQLLARDAVVPGSSLLGYVNADHLAMAIPISKQIPALATLFRDDLPRSSLVSAAIAVVDQAIADPSSSERRP